MDTILCEKCGECLAITVFKSGLRMKPDRHVCFKCYPAWHKSKQEASPGPKGSIGDKITTFVMGKQKPAQELTPAEKAERDRKKKEADAAFYGMIGGPK